LKNLILFIATCLLFLACTKEKTVTNEVFIDNTWKPVYLGAGNTVLNATQIGAEYYIGFSESVLTLIGGAENRYPTKRSYAYMPLDAAPGFAYNTTAYVSRDSIYIAKLSNLEETKAVAKLSELGVDGFSYAYQLADVYSDGILVNEFNEMIIPLYKTFEQKLAYAYLSVVGDVGSTDQVFLGDNGLVDEINGLEEGEYAFKKIIQSKNYFFFLTHNSGLYKVQRNFAVKTLLGQNIMDVFQHGGNLAAVVKDTVTSVNRLYISTNNGDSWSTVNNFPALDTLNNCSRSFFSDGSEIFSYSDCAVDGLFSHKLVGNSVSTTKLKVDGVDGFQGRGMIIEGDRLLFATQQGVFSAHRDSIYAEENN
jgi:hypothetical protein